MQKAILALLFCFLAVPYATAQSGDADVVAELEEAYRQLDYELAASMAQGALENYGDYTVEELAQIHTFLALIAYNRGDLRDARRQFISALQLAPELELNPVLVAPRIQTYFEDVRLEAASDDSQVSPAAPRYVLVRDPRSDAALRSMLVPGWGQLYKGHTAKAYAIAGLFAATAGGAVLAHARRSEAKDLYDAASTIQEASDRFETYNTWHRARNGLVQGAVLVWAVSYVDALLTGTSRMPSESLALHVAPSTFSLRVRF